jgi:NitT/TauT family transport system permease protein
VSDSAYEVVLPPPRRRSGRYARSTLNGIAPLLAAAGLVALWELWVRVGGVDPLVLPAPSDVAARMADRAGILWDEALVTVQEIVVGFGIATALGLLCALLIVAVRPIELTIYPILVASQVVPKIAIAPLIFIWFGLGNTSRIIIVVLLSFFPIVIAGVVGLKSLEPAKLHLARSIGAGTIATFVRFRIPQALPDIFSGLKLAATRAVGAAIVAEFISSGEGLGRAIFLATYDLRPDIALAGVGYLVVIGVASFFAVAIAERLLIPWHVSVRAGRR